MGHITLVATAGTIILVPYHEVKSLQLIWRSGTRRIHLRGARSSNELQWFDLMTGHQDSSSSNGHQVDMPYC